MHNPVCLSWRSLETSFEAYVEPPLQGLCSFVCSTWQATSWCGCWISPSYTWR